MNQPINPTLFPLYYLLSRTDRSIASIDLTMPLRRTSAAAASSTATPPQEAALPIVYIKTTTGRDNTADMSSSSSTTSSEQASECGSCRSNNHNNSTKDASRCSNLVVRTQQESASQTYESSGTSPNVSFSTITIREYARRMGDNPGCKTGVSLTIEWKVQYEVSISLDEYEETRPARRERTELSIPPDVRMQMVRESGFARSEILQYVKAANIARQQRMRTNETLQLAPAQEFTERLLRGILSKSLRRKQKKQEKQLLQVHLEKDQQLWFRNMPLLKTRVKRRSTSSTMSTAADEAATLTTACPSEYDEESYAAKQREGEEEESSEQPEEVEASDSCDSSPKVAKAVLDLDFSDEDHLVAHTSTSLEC